LGEERFPAERILILAEPEGKNTAPAIAYACIVLQDVGTAEDTLMVMPADHTIEPLSPFLEDVSKAAALAGEGWLVTFGIPPEGPETGYGYVEAAEALGPGFKVRSFKEKPDEATARSFLAQGNHYWNSGMFAFRADRFLEELHEHAPEVARPFLEASIAEIPRSGPTGNTPIILQAGYQMEAVYRKTVSISIDYAVMEYSKRSAVVRASFSWSDVGSWDVVARLFGAQLERQRLETLIAVDSEENFVLSDLPVALAGVKDLIVVVKNGTVLVCRRGKSQLVKDIVQMLKEGDRTELL
jgi:mannose-1-phosphate guanylyltransferase/mannose-6-phosphate isomerase